MWTRGERTRSNLCCVLSAMRNLLIPTGLQTNFRSSSARGSAKHRMRLKGRQGFYKETVKTEQRDEQSVTSAAESVEFEAKHWSRANATSPQIDSTTCRDPVL